MIELRVRRRVDLLVAPIGRGLARIGVRPIHLTLTGLGATLVGSILLGRGVLEIGAMIILAGSTLDGLDGAVARAAGTASKQGALVDSVSDRLGESAMFAACAFWLTSASSPGGNNPELALLCVLSLGAALMTSYLRAKAESVGVDGRGGLMGRAERVILFSAGFLFGQASLMLWAMAILTWITVGQRFWKTWVQLGAEPSHSDVPSQ